MKTQWMTGLALVGVAFVWGVAFVVMKPALQQEPLWDFIATRFSVAVVVMLLFRPTIVRQISPKILTRGSVLGVILAVGFLTQSIGLTLNTAATTGFITGLYVVVVPLLSWILYRTPIAGRVWAGVALAFTGLALISINGFGFNVTQIWVLVGALLFALHYVVLARWSPGLSSYALTLVQLTVATAVAWIGALVDGYQPPPTLNIWLGVAFTGIFATAVAYFVQTWAESRMDASRVAVILTLEVVFAAIVAVAVGQEVLALKTIVGGVLIVLAMFVVEWPSRKLKVPTAI
ncbi:MAG: EamA family transporter [Actinobacteria bacterium]|nr:EamA family transporter [Actinomycetota bacterium]